MNINNIKINIPGFGERFCSNNVEYRLYNLGNCYVFFKKGTDIRHNEYGPAIEYKDGTYSYFINYKYHRLSDYAYYDSKHDNKLYYIFDKFLGYTKKHFIKNLANSLIPIEKDG